MQVRVAFFGPVRQAVPAGEMEVSLSDGATVDELLASLARQYGRRFTRAVRQEDGQIWATIAVLVNGQNIHLASGLATALSNGDQMAIVPVITGG